MNYRVKFRPLEPYTFGTDQTFPFEGTESEKTGKESYLVISGRTPAQTTLWGTLRYLVLQKQGKLRRDFQYSGAEDVKPLIGAKSFDFQSDTVQSFGKLRGMSPLFLLRQTEGGQERILIPNPFNNCSEKRGYCPMKLRESPLWTSHGNAGIHLPADDEYNAKTGHANGWIDLMDKEIYPAVWNPGAEEGKTDARGLFASVVVPGNQKSRDNGDEGYFQREMILLHPDCSFAVYVDAEAGAFTQPGESLPVESVVYMGKKRSAFRVTVEESDAPSLNQTVEEAFADAPGPWYYALSDAVLLPENDYQDFCIVEETFQRTLKTNYNSRRRYAGKLVRSAIRFNLIRAGSVFYGSCPLNVGSNPGVLIQNCQSIGYHHIVKLGG